MPVPTPPSSVPKKVLVDIYCADGATRESILVDPLLTVGGALKLMAEKSCVDCHVKWGLVERLPELFIDRYVFLFIFLMIKRTVQLKAQPNIFEIICY